MPANERFHTIAAYDNADHAAFAQLPFVPEGITNLQNSNLVVPDWNLVGAVYGLATTLTGIQLTAPSLTGMWPIDVYPFQVGAAPSTPFQLWDVFDSPVRFIPNEQLQVQTRNSGGAAVDQAVFLWLFPRRPTPIQSDVRTLHAAGATTVAGFTWTPVPITLDQLLPAGRYALVGLAANSTTMLAARIVFVGGVYRPGVVATPALGIDTYYRFRYGNLGVFGEFDHNLVPTIEVFCSAADTAQDFYLDLVKIG